MKNLAKAFSIALDEKVRVYVDESLEIHITGLSGHATYWIDRNTRTLPYLIGDIIGAFGEYVRMKEAAQASTTRTA